MIKIEHLKKEYEGVTPLKDVSVEINDGDVIAVIGPSGTGKSTLLRCINLLEEPTGGHIFIDDEEITDPNCDVAILRRKVGMVFQSFNLFGHMTVIENIMFSPMTLLGVSKKDAYERGMKLLRTVGLAQKALPHITDAYKGEIVGLIKATAVVGYIAVQDLTKVGDIIRSRTYEAFFPLIAVTVIYFLLEGLITFTISRISISTDPKRRKKESILKGVK